MKGRREYVILVGLDIDFNGYSIIKLGKREMFAKYFRFVSNPFITFCTTTNPSHLLSTNKMCANSNNFQKEAPISTPHSFPFDANESNEINILCKTTSYTPPPPPSPSSLPPPPEQTESNDALTFIYFCVRLCAVCVYVDVWLKLNSILKFKSTISHTVLRTSKHSIRV